MNSLSPNFADASPGMAELRPCAVLLLPGCSLLALAGVLEALQAVNDLQLDARYVAELRSADGGLVKCGSLALPTIALADQAAWHAVLLLSGEGAMPSLALLQWLREQATAGVALAGIDGGSAVLAEAGLLAAERATVNAHLAEALQDEFPDVVWSGNVWEINADASRLSCAGGSASLDLMIAWLGRSHGERLAQDLTLKLGLERARGRDERQRRPVAEQRGGSPKLAEALSLMEANLAEPLPTEDVARLVGVSRRQLERLFKQHLDALPSRYYLELRLNRARRLLQQSGQSILQIGLSCGFSSGPHFSNAYKAHFDKTPRDERSQRAIAWRRPAGDPT
ncbi:helix-turn-helix domain-containing protein [Paucibacter sp. B2R-40]|uniref:GlxA family transcriptional regulator n=1 Tax=Paucibacter sp. B2R-40 TaxID=2893554 RepID=UPI0021E3A25F|nr:helix-turn-helix domain-containing protein [Paucibacter sp. B2R-40]MCV2353946.1 helix-turn-helix domain-containing protein [Paucibacter sp. B2R-40]